MRKLSILSMLLWGAATANAQTATNDSVKVTLDTLEVTAQAGAPVYQASAPLLWEIRNTRVALTFDRMAKTADAREWVKLHPFLYPSDTITFDAKGMRIDSVLLVGRKGNSRLDYKYDHDRLRIHFDRQYTAADSVELFFKYKSVPYDAPSGGSGAITDDRGLYFINTDNKVPNKPAHIWTQGETESNSHWMITVDKPNTRFTTQIELTVPDSLVTLSNGAMTKQVKGANGMRTDVWKMDMPIQAYAVMFAIGKYSVVKDKWRNKEVNYYVEPEFAPSAKLMFNHTPEMMEYFSQRTGVLYPWNKYHQVVVRDYVSGAMENTSASLFGEFMNQTAREIADRNSEDVVSHELFHQWFGDYVTAESWSNITVNESFANYGEQLWRAHKYGKASGDELAYNDLQGYIGSAQVNDPQLVRFYYDSREEVFDAISYNKGGAILRYLNTLAGDAGFDRAMNIYLTKNALHSGEAHNWRMAVEEATGQDWNWFFNEWYFRAGHPSLKVLYNYNDTTQKLSVIVNQVQSDSTFMYRLPLKAALIYGSEKTILNWDISRKTDTFTFAYKNGVKPVVVPDYEHVLPGELKDTKKPAQWLVQYMQCTDYTSKRLAVSAAGRLMSDSTSQVLIDMALNDGLASIRRHALAQISSTSNDKYKKKWTGKVVAMAANDSNRLVRAEAFDVLGTWKANGGKQTMLNALYDSSYAVSGAALEALAKIEKDTAYIIARSLFNTNPKSSLDGAIWSILGKKGADEDIALYEKRAPYVLGQKKFTFAFSLNNYLKNVKSADAFERGIAIYKTLIVNENMKSYRSTLGGFLFQVAAEQKTLAKSDKKEDAEMGQQRLARVKVALQSVVDSEKDPENSKDYKKMMKDNFE